MVTLRPITTHFTTSTFVILVCCVLLACGSNSKKDGNASSEPAIQLLEVGAEPWATFLNGQYYFTQGCEDKIVIWKTDDLRNLSSAESKIVWTPDNPQYGSHIWGPELHNINGKWYTYFAADDGNMDNHQIYVIENSSADPLQGNFEFKGRVSTDSNNNWAIHASVFEFDGSLYMIWSGWQSPRIEIEEQCIYIARMENPWTLSSERVLISRPQHEWERQWVNPDGTKTAYPIFVNEAPQFLLSKNRQKLMILYCASGNWTPFYSVGMLTADAGSNLLDPSSWVKSAEPVFAQNPKDSVFATGNLSFVPTPGEDGTSIVYHARSVPNEQIGSADSRSPRMQKIEWSDDGSSPILGRPAAPSPYKKIELPNKPQ